MSADPMTPVVHACRPPVTRNSRRRGVRVALIQFMRFLVNSAFRTILPGLKDARGPKKAYSVAWLAIMFCCAPAVAQIDTATLSGSIADTSGTAVARALVELI